MGIGEHLKTALVTLRKRSTKSLVALEFTSGCAVLVFGCLQFFAPSMPLPWGQAISIVCIFGLTIASSVFAACIVSVLFDLKSIRELIVKNDADLLLKMILRSDELFSTREGTGGEHEAILKNIRLKATAALNGIDLDEGRSSADELLLRRGHLVACLDEHDKQVNDVYAKYVNVSRRISKVARGVYQVSETTYVRYRNDTGGSKMIGSWNKLDSGLLPQYFSRSNQNALKESVTITINESLPLVFEHDIECEIISAEGVDERRRRWKNNWKEEGILTDIPPNGTCVIEMKREFLIPEGEEISYSWSGIRGECNYSLEYCGDDAVPTIALIGCDLCNDVDEPACVSCKKEPIRLVKNEGRSKMVSVKQWPATDLAIRVTWTNRNQSIKHVS